MLSKKGHARVPALKVAVALSVCLGVIAAPPAMAAAVKVHTQRISPPSPFSPASPCAQDNPGFSPGFGAETSVAVNPRDPRNILVSWIQDGRATDIVMASRNGGRSFSRILVPGLTPCTGGDFDLASDPGVDFAAGGRMAYFASIVVNLPDSGGGPGEIGASGASPAMLVNRSFDGGFSWTRPATIQPPTGDFWDLPRLTAHPRKPKTAYNVFDLRKPPGFFSGYSLISTTSDGGRSWSKPRTLYDPKTSNSWPGISKLLVNRDGSLLVVFALIGANPNDLNAPRTTQEQAVRSRDGGRTWSKPVTIGTSSGRIITDPASGNALGTFNTFGSQTVAPNGDVYVSWLQPGATSSASTVAVARSTDGGRHWRTRRLPVRGQAAIPTVEVAGDGTVGVLYYTIAAASRNGNWPTRVSLAISRDRGRHWRRRTVAGPFNMLTTGNKARPCCWVGDYLGSGRLRRGMVFAFSMGKPIAKNNVDVYFTRIRTSR